MLACFNRINATGLKRHHIKLIEKVFILAFFAIPAWIAWSDGLRLWHWLSDPAANSTQAFTVGTRAYAVVTTLALIALLPEWLLGRWEYWRESPHLLEVSLHRWQIDHAIDRTSPKRKYSFASRIPKNEIGQLERSLKTLYLPWLDDCWNGTTIGHLSDIHLTGGMTDAYYRFAFEKLMDMKPQMIVLSGDLLDYDHQLPVLLPVIADLKAPMGCYFVLGNHDRRLENPNEIRSLLTSQNWIDLGNASHAQSFDRGVLKVIGNERPWFPGVALDWPRSADESRETLRIAVAHSPDQFRWASRLGSHLLLTGHTHGGQVRLPGIGPIVAPSWHGSRYASGVFRKGNTVMHVSRGLSGVHPLRWNCLPEVSVLCLTNRTS